MFRSSAWRVEQSRLRRLTLLSPEPPSASRRQGPSLRERETRSFSVREALHAEVRARRSRKTGQADCSSLPLWQVRTRLSEVAAFEACGSSFFLGISLTGASREESQRGLDGQSKALQNEILGQSAEKCTSRRRAAHLDCPIPALGSARWPTQLASATTNSRRDTARSRIRRICEARRSRTRSCKRSAAASLACRSLKRESERE